MRKYILLATVLITVLLPIKPLGITKTLQNPIFLDSSMNSTPILQSTLVAMLTEQIAAQTPTVRPTTANCSPDQVVEKIKVKNPGNEFFISYTIIEGSRQMFFWYVDHKINSGAKKEDLEKNFELAVTDSIAMAYDMKKSDKCVSELFDFFNPIIVDKNFNGWFSGLIATADIPDDPGFIQVEEKTNKLLFQSDELDVALKSLYSHTVWEREELPEIQQIPDDSCSWGEVQGKINRHFYDSPLNVHMLISDNSGLTFTIQYKSKRDDPMDAIEVFLNTEKEISCFRPKVDNITVIIVGEDGKWLTTQRVPLNKKQNSQG